MSGRRRLVVELSARTAADLDWITKAEDINKTTAVNRAVQVYRLVSEAQARGDGLTIAGESVRFL